MMQSPKSQDPLGVEEYRRALDEHHHLVCEWDATGSIVHCNRAYRRFFGLPASSGVSGRRAVHRGADEPSHAFDGGPPARSIVRSHGNRTVEWCDTVVLDTSGHPVSIVSVGVDVTALLVTTRDIAARRDLQAALDRCRADSEAARRQRVAFVANVSRELRGPVQAISGTSELLARAGLPATAALLTDGLRRRAAALRRTLDDLLDHQQLEVGTLQLSVDEVDLVELVEGAVGEARAHLLPGVVLHIDADRERRPRIRIDGARLCRIVVHLVTNACRNTTQGTVTVRVVVGDDADRFRIEVADTGHGIAPADQERIFTPYERNRSGGHIGSGLGLGLPLARGLAEAMGGTLGFTSRESFGSVFWIEIPLDAGSQPTDEPGGRLRVLVVLADDVGRLSLGHRLEELGARPVLVADGEHALVCLEAERFDLLVLDVHLAGISALEIARRFRRAAPRPYIVGVSSSASAADRASCFEAGVDIFMASSVSDDELNDVIEAARRTRSH